MSTPVDPEVNADLQAARPAPPPGDVPITDTQRNGTMTGMAVVLGFSLSFTATWTQGKDPWRWRGVPVLVLAVIGVALQVSALFSALSLPPLSVSAHRRATQGFRLGVISVLAAYALHISFDLLCDLFHICL